MSDGNDMKISVNELHIEASDFTGVNFATMDISDTYFDGVKLDDAVLVPRKYTNVSFGGSNWWNAKIVDPKLLVYLTTYMYPRKITPYWYNNRPTKDQYERAVNDLCRGAGIVCGPLKFESE
jgi:hypothetical protein